MALNPFEQIRLFLSEPRTAFEDIVGTLLEDAGEIDGRIKVHLGDGGIDAYKGSFGEGGELIVYQSKYFADQWKDPQKQQIRDSFRTASESRLFNLKAWYLCVPTRPTKEDVRWFDDWKAKQPIKKIELIDGDDLTRMFEMPNGARARQKLRNWGVSTVREGCAVLEFSVVCVARDPRTQLTFNLVVWLTNKGDRTAEGLKVRVEHSSTNCVVFPSDSSLWEDRGNGVPNPRTVWAKTNLNPGEPIQVLQLPLRAETPFPFWIKASASLRDMSPTEQSIVLQHDQLANGTTFVLKPGGLEATASLDGGFRSDPLRLPSPGGPGDDLWTEIAQNPDHSLFGLLHYWKGDAADQSKTNYRPSLSPTGYNHSIDKAQLAAALKELVDLGWLDPADRVGDVDLYRLSNRARQNEIFWYNVKELAKRREYQ